MSHKTLGNTVYIIFLDDFQTGYENYRSEKRQLSKSFVKAFNLMNKMTIIFKCEMKFTKTTAVDM